MTPLTAFFEENNGDEDSKNGAQNEISTFWLNFSSLSFTIIMINIYIKKKKMNKSKTREGREREGEEKGERGGNHKNWKEQSERGLFLIFLVNMGAVGKKK